MLVMASRFVFFFQAEDGIRDADVTGVQTCALPILLLAPEFFQPLRTLAQHYHDRAAALGAADGLMALLAEEPDPVRRRRAEATDDAETLVELAGAEVVRPGRGRVLSPCDLRDRKSTRLNSSHVRISYA